MLVGSFLFRLLILIVYLHYQTFPRIVALAEVAWVNSDERDEVAF